MKYCYKCKTPLDNVNTVGFQSECEKCGSDLHVCKNCKFYDISKPYECAEKIEESIIDKEKRNFCEMFRFKDGLTEESNIEKNLKDARERWKKLFKD